MSIGETAALDTVRTIRFTRNAGQPQASSETIATTGFEGPFVILVRSGDADGAHRVSSAALTVDGEQLLGQRDFNQQQHSWSFTRPLGAATTVTADISSKPGAFLEVTILGKRAAARFCPGDAGSHQTMDEALAAALDAAGPDGTVIVCDGVHTVADAYIRRGVTVRSEHRGGATIRAGDIGGVEVAFEVIDLPAGETVRFVDIGFDAGSPGIVGYAVYAYGNSGRVAVDSGRFTSAGPARHIMVLGGGAPTAEVAVQRSTFEGGAFAIWQQGPVHMRVLNNTFDRNVAIQFQGVFAGDDGVVQEVVGNTMSNCGYNCLRISRAGNARVEDNVVSNQLGRSVQVGIHVNRQPGVLGSNALIVRNNRVLGAGVGSSRGANDAYAFRNVGIEVGDRSPAADRNIVTGNTVTSAFHGIQVVTGSFDARDNAVTSSRWGVAVRWPAQVDPLPTGDGVFQRNDIVDAISGYAGPTMAGIGYLACNYWGSTYAPALPGNIPGTAYAPWATAPIAGTDTECNPTAMPMLVKVCPSPDGTTAMSRTVFQAVAVTGAGGEVVVCDGVHKAWDIGLGGRAITVRAENPLGATLDGDGKGSTFYTTGGGAVVVRGFRFVNAEYNNIVAHGTYESLLVEDSEFYPDSTMKYGDALVGGANSIGYRAGVGAYDAVGGGVTVRNSTFIGGDIGFNSANSNGLRVEGSTFLNQNNAAVHIGGPPTGFNGSAVVVNNTVQGCSSHWCMGFFGVANATVEGNAVSTTAARRSRNGIHMRAANATIRNNTISGTSLGADRWKQASYDIEQGVALYQTQSGVVSGNRVTRAWGGLWLDQSAGTFTDNVVTTSAHPIGAWGPAGSTVSAVVRNNDFADWQRALDWPQNYSSLDARCNWWGTPAGLNATSAPGFAASVYTPWATAPIAGGASGCTP